MRRTTAALAAGLTLLVIVAQGGTGSTAPSRHLNRALRQALAAESGASIQFLPNGLPAPLVSGAVMQVVREHNANAGSSTTTTANAPASGLAIPNAPTIGTTGCPNVFSAPGFPDNVRANQDCGYRFQGEEQLAVNPTDPNNITYGQNDSKLNGNRTGINFSVDGGSHWGDSVLPTGRVPVSVPGGLWSFDAFSDPALTYDSRGNMYYSAIGFDFLQDGFSGVWVWKSLSCTKGAYIHNPASGSCSPFSPPLSVTAAKLHDNFATPDLFEDKQFMAADAHAGSPYRDNVYVTYTIFDQTCSVPSSIDSTYCQSPIYFQRSTDGGVTWTDAKIISGANPAICTGGNAFNPDLDPGACNFSQGSYPVVGPDGTIYVVFHNGNTPSHTFDDNANGGQQLLVKSTNGGASWSAPVRVGLDYNDQPYSVPGNVIKDCALFRQCLPPNSYRMNDFPALGIDETTGKLAVFWSDFRNGGPCATDSRFGEPLPVKPCDSMDNDVFVSVSANGGGSWGPAKLVSTDPAAPANSRTAAQWQAWGDVGENGNLYVAYYDRQYGNCERSGCNDIVLATSTDNGDHWSYTRVTTSSMPSMTCRINPNQCGFLGDYMSVVWANATTHIGWSDTRGLGGTTEEDVYYARVAD